MKKITIGINSSGGFLRADSDPMSDDDVREQLSAVATAKENGPDTIVQLSWIVLRSADVLFARSSSL